MFQSLITICERTTYIERTTSDRIMENIKNQSSGKLIKIISFNNKRTSLIIKTMSKMFM